MTQRRTGWVMRKLIRNQVGFIGFCLSVLVVLLALFAPLIKTHSPNEQSVRDRFEGPSAEHFLGTDNFGRDLYTRILYGYRTSITVALVSVGFATLVGGLIGLLAAFYGGLVDRVLMRIMDVLLAFPIILLAIGVLAVLGPGTFNTALAIGIVYTPIFARLARGPALTLLSWDYVVAATALGASSRRVLTKHIAPNILAPILVQVTLSLSTAIWSRRRCRS